jgi:F420-non-reducing hydrogenase iron-sulfur subunit
MTPAKSKTVATEEKSKARAKAPPEKPRAAAKAATKRPRGKASAGGVKARAKAKKTAAPRKARKAKSRAREGFVPRVVVFACNWCSYAGADAAGVSRIQYSPHFRIIRVMCSGRVHPAFVLRAFELGADGVLVSGCHFGDCHYIFGNERAVEQFEKTKALLKILGLEEGRIRLEWISAAEGVKFGRVIDEFVEQVRALGPSTLAPPGRELPREAEAFADAAALAK